MCRSGARSRASACGIGGERSGHVAEGQLGGGVGSSSRPSLRDGEGQRGSARERRSECAAGWESRAVTPTDGRGAREDQPELHDEDAWWILERAAVPPAAEASPAPVLEPPPLVEPAPTPPPPIAPLPRPRVLVPTTSRSWHLWRRRGPHRERPRSGGRRRRVLVAGVLALALAGLVAALVVRKGNDAPEVATKGATLARHRHHCRAHDDCCAGRWRFER